MVGSRGKWCGVHKEMGKEQHTASLIHLAILVIGYHCVRKTTGAYSIPTSCRMIKVSSMYYKDHGWRRKNVIEITKCCFEGMDLYIHTYLSILCTGSTEGIKLVNDYVIKSYSCTNQVLIS